MVEPVSSNKTNKELATDEYLRIKERTEALSAEASERSSNNTFTPSFAREFEAQMAELSASLIEVKNIFRPQLEEVRQLLGYRFIGPEEIGKALNVVNLGVIAELPLQLMEALMSDSLITPGKKVFEDHRLIYLPESFDGKPNSVMNLKELVQCAEAERKKSEPKAGSVFANQEDWYSNENWVKASVAGGRWILTPDTVPNDTRNIDFTAQSEIITNNYTAYVRGDALELISLLGFTELLTRERLYSGETCGRTETETDPAGGSPEQHVYIGPFFDDGMLVGMEYDWGSEEASGAFIRWNFHE